jgi:hypothetical protein
MCYTLLLLTLLVLLQEIQCFFYALEWGYFAQSSCSSPMKTLRGRQDSFEKLTQFTMVNKVLTLLLQTLKILLQELQWSFNSLEWGDFAKRWCSSPMKTLRGKQYSFKELTEFTILNKFLDPLPSNIGNCVTRATVLLPFTCRGPFWTKLMFVTYENTER